MTAEESDRVEVKDDRDDHGGQHARPVAAQGDKQFGVVDGSHSHTSCL